MVLWKAAPTERGVLFQNGKRSTFEMRRESNRLEVGAAKELASCCGVNLAVAGLCVLGVLLGGFDGPIEVVVLIQKRRGSSPVSFGRFAARLTSGAVTEHRAEAPLFFRRPYGTSQLVPLHLSWWGWM